MKTTDLQHHGVYGLNVRGSEMPRPAIVLDTKPWEHGQKTVRDAQGNLSRVYALGLGSKQRRPVDSPYVADYSVGIPVIVLDHSVYRWFEDLPDNERLVSRAAELLNTALDSMDLETVIERGETSPDSLLRKIAIAGENAQGVTVRVNAEAMLIRPQNLLGPWGPLLKEQQEQRVAHLAKVAETEKVRTRADVLDHDVADRLDALLGAKDRLEYNGLRPDVVRLRGDETFQVSVGTFLQLLELAERHRP